MDYVIFKILVFYGGLKSEIKKTAMFLKLKETLVEYERQRNLIKISLILH